jgi:hypothetical protein
MELPFYLISPESAWDGLVSLHGDDLHFILRGGEENESTEFDIPLEKVESAEFQRGLVSRKLALKVRSEELRRYFPAGIYGEEIHLMVARDDPEFGPFNNEGNFERLAGAIAERNDAGSRSRAGGLAN